STKPRVSKLEFFVALALVALAQLGKDVSIEQVVVLSSQNTLAQPTPDLNRLQPSLSAIPPITSSARKNSTQTVRAPLPAYSSDDPWNVNPRFLGAPSRTPFGVDGLPNGTPSSPAGTGAPNEWWKKQETIKTSIPGQQGFILNRYTVYEVASDVSRFIAPLYTFALLRRLIAQTTSCLSSILRICLPLGRSRSSLSIPAFPLVTS
ncbi:hypothetical protein BDZ97DRAFT_1657838, partial [Flammula alnicola]